MNILRLGVFFGGISPEHEVSVITGVQLMKHADTHKYQVVPVYLDKSGKWWTGDQLKDIAYYRTQNLYQPTELSEFNISLQPDPQPIDVAILCFHGAYGEAGNIQGALELAGIPYQGPAVTSSAVAFDKIMTRQILDGAGIQQTPYTWFSIDQWNTDKKTLLNNIEKLTYPVFVKPANGGSTIGVEKVNSAKDIEKTVANVLKFDQRVIVEKAVVECLEINVSVVGLGNQTQASVPEQPLQRDEFLSFADKYQRGGKKSGMASASRRIPAPISDDLTVKIQEEAKLLFHLFDCSGVVRIDFFANPTTEEIFVTELNTLPGSMSYYLWEASGMKYPQLIDKLVEIAQQRSALKAKNITSFETNILATANV